MNALWAKEWRSLKPFFILIILFFGLDLFFVPLTGYPDQQTLYGGLGLIEKDGYTAYSVLFFFLSISLSYGLLIREKDQDTLLFLDALPTTRNQVFWTKFLLAYVVLLTGPLIEVAVSTLFHLWSRTSLDSGYPWALVGTVIFLYGVQSFIFLSTGLALSFLRRFGWLATGFAVTGYMALKKIFPAITVLNPLQLVRPVFEGSTWVIPWQAILIQGSFGLIFLMVAWLLFLGRGFTLTTAISKLKNHWPGRVALGCGTLAIPALWITFIIFLAREDLSDQNPPKKVSFSQWQTSRFYLDPYVFLIPENRESKAQPLLDRARQVHETVVGFLEAEPLAEIVVDATRPPAGGYAGLAFWKTIRLGLSSQVPDGELLATLGHETAHVYIESISNKRMGQAFQWTRFFHEGLASYVEYRFFHQPGARDGKDFQAAVIFSRKELSILDLVDDKKLVQKHDPFLVYSLGERFADALVFRYGDRAPAQLLKAMGRKDAPKHLQGLSLWRDTFRAAEMNFDEVVNVFYQRLDQEAKRLKDRIATLPRLFGAVLEEPEQIGILPELEFDWDGEISCRVRRQEEDRPETYKVPEADEEGIFWLPREDYPTLQFQLAVKDPVTQTLIFEPWTEVAISR